MPRNVLTNAASLILTLLPRDNEGDLLEGILFSDVDLTISYRTSTSNWVSITLVTSTPGTWVSGGWIHLGNGLYQLGLPNAAIVSNDRTTIRFEYTDSSIQYDSIDAVIIPSIIPLLPDNFSDLFIDSAGRVRPTPASIAFNIGVETPNIGFDSSGFVYVKELNRTVTFTANTDIEGINLVLVFENSDRTDILVVPDEELTKVGNVVTYILPESLTQNEGTLIWGIREATDQTVYGFGQIQIVYAPHED